MKELSNYINEKLDIDKVSLDDFVEKFPITGNLPIFIDYLKEHKFKEITYDGTDIQNLIDHFDSNHDKSFIYNDGENLKWVRFANTYNKNISKKNPIFSIIKDYGTDNYTFYTEYKTYWEKELSAKNWYEELKKCF